jgi:uncharacterized membrane protein YebE (DUF533 family)
MSREACVEALSALVAFAWADGRLDERERASVRGAAEALDLSPEMRERVDLVLERPPKIEHLFVDELGPREREFVYIAAAWICGADDDMDEKEEAHLDELARALNLHPVRKAELETRARRLEPPPHGQHDWHEELVRLFETMPQVLAGDRARGDGESFPR